MEIRAVPAREAHPHGVQGPCARYTTWARGPVRTGSDPVGTGSSQPSLKPREEGRDGMRRSYQSKIHHKSTSITRGTSPKHQGSEGGLQRRDFPKKIREVGEDSRRRTRPE